MQVRIWQSFSCNNSSSYRLIARFSDSIKAAAVAAELEALRRERSGGPSRTAPMPERGALAQVIGFDWDEWFPYGDEEDPTVAAEAEVLAVYHSYCLGFPPEFTAWLQARGAELEAKVDPQFARTPQVSALFTLPASGSLEEDLTSAFAEAAAREASGRPMHLPWTDLEQWGVTAFFCDGETAGFSAPIVPADLPLLKRWLAERGVDRPGLRLCAYDDTAKFATIARSRCSGCGGGLRYVEPVRYGLDAEQLACSGCGAMYELSVLRAAAERKVDAVSGS